MKKNLLFAFVWLTLTAVWGSGLLFAGGGADKDRDRQPRVADLADLAEVKEEDYTPRQNPGVGRASGSVYALPGEPLRPDPERLPPPVYAISGVKGVEISETSPLAVDIIVNLPEKEAFSRGILEGEDVSGWIENLPPGLEARARGVKKGARAINIFISGTPERTAREQVRVSIPGTYLAGGKARQFVSPTEEESFDSWKKSQTE
jgi:hypothetical protein